MRKPPISSSRDRVAHHRIDRRVDAQRLLDHPARVEQSRQVLDGRRPAPEDVIDLGAEPGLGLGISAEQIHGPRQRDGRRLVAGPDEGQDLVAQLDVGEPFPCLLVARGQEHGEQVARVAVGLATSTGDDVENQGVEGLQSPSGSQVPRRRHTGREDEQIIDPALEILQGRRDGLADPVGLTGEVDAQESLADDPERQPRELDCDVERFPAPGMLPPSSKHRADCAGHQLGQGRDSLMMEGRLGQPPQPPPGCPFRRHQALANDHLGAIVIPAPRIVLRVVDQHVLDVVRVRKLMEHHRAQLVTEDVAVSPQPVEQEPQRIMPRPSHRTEIGQRHELTHPRSRVPPVKRYDRHVSPPATEFPLRPVHHIGLTAPACSKATSSLRHLSIGRIADVAENPRIPRCGPRGHCGLRFSGDCVRSVWHLRAPRPPRRRPNGPACVRVVEPGSRSNYQSRKDTSRGRIVVRRCMN